MRHGYIGCMINDSHEFSIIRRFLLSFLIVLYPAKVMNAPSITALYIEKCHAVCHTLFRSASEV